MPSAYQDPPNIIRILADGSTTPLGYAAMLPGSNWCNPAENQIPIVHNMLS